MEVSGIDATSETFKVTTGSDTVTYTLNAENLLKGDDGKLYTISDGVFNFDSDSGASIIEVTANGILDVAAASETGNYTIVDSVAAPAAVYGTVEYNAESGTYTFEIASATNVTKLTNVPAEGATVSGFEGTVNTEKGSGTYTIGSNTFKADSSTLVIVATASESKLADGIVIVNADSITTTSDSTVTYTAGTSTTANGVSVVVSDGAVVSISDIENGESFTIDDETYAMYGAGLLTESNTKILTASKVDGFSSETTANLASSDLSLKLQQTAALPLQTFQTAIRQPFLQQQHLTHK